MAVKQIPDNYNGVIPYLIVNDGNAAIEFYKKAFSATETMRLTDPSGKISHSEIKINNSPVMLGDEHAEMGYKSPKSLGGSSVSLMIYVVDVDASFVQAINAGATVMRAVEDQFYGDRTGTLIDPFGHIWTLATHTEDVSPTEIDKRFAAYFS
jgi:PhnB protein